MGKAQQRLMSARAAGKQARRDGQGQQFNPYRKMKNADSIRDLHTKWNRGWLDGKAIDRNEGRVF